MDYRKFGDTYAVRLAPGEEVCESLLALCKKEKLGAGTVSGIGAAGKATLGVYRVAEQVYVSRSLDGEFEIASLMGNISQQAGQPYLHLHAVLSDAGGGVYAGHLSEAYISATAEIFITTLQGELGRKRDERLGINLMVL